MPNDLYPNFSTISQATPRTQRLETGAQRTQRGQLRPTAGNFVRMPQSTLKTIGSTQVIDITKPTVRKIGAVSPSSNTYGFAYTSTVNSITWFWDGTNGSTVIVITRADGKKQTIPPGSLQITGLANATTYYFLPFWAPFNGSGNVGWVKGTIGTPQIAFVIADTVNVNLSPAALMTQNAQQNEPLTGGFMTALTGAGGGGGGGGGGGSCVHISTNIQPLGNISLKTKRHVESRWIRIEMADKRELFCTVDHPLYHAVNGKINAELVKVGDLMITDKGEMEVVETEQVEFRSHKYSIHMPEGHLYFANGLLSHNAKAGK